ncbi:ABC transporter substrate-binding protein [Faecalicatena sp. AGMB00832]|uniref:ABC transporter substrate-binding protein n=1 Tax=Faecalicatena faecalis TaxID=2726362 RepID=A0ABS6D5H2_9FIRM|nr:ABC transporter substrate-binding protein [Faecalicatena faecalis]MBU3876858.1 ABC transporter substrate-binding protein [Faecalicatena faecalis]
MKKRIIALLLSTAMALSLLSACSSKDSPKETSSNTVSKAQEKDSQKEMKDVTLNEVAHSIFYAPMYVAVEEGYFKEEGINLDLVCGFGADKTMTAVLSGEADIGFMGSEASIYTYNEGANDYVVNFAQLTQRAGNFLVAREEMSDFSWDALKDSSVLGGRKGGRPKHDVTFENIREIYEWTSQKALDLAVFKYDEKITSAS